MGNAKKYLLAGFAFFLALIWAGLGWFYFQASRPADANSPPVIVEINPGMNLKQVAGRLAKRKLIRDPRAFRLLAYVQKRQNQIKAGEYEFSGSMLPVEILEKITSGKTVLYPVTIREGLRITEIATLLEERQLADRERFLRETRNPRLGSGLNLPGDSLEGYLFPDTYHFGKKSGEFKIVKTMVDTFKKRVYLPKFIRRAAKVGFSFHEIVTLASLIEKETGRDAERKMISSVFHNRLKKKMLLQADPTVIYAIENFDGNIRKRDLSIDSPYNTYRYRGLPPGPIASPGLKSVAAALYPAQTNYLYFVSRQDGSHEFSTNLADHNRAVTKYQLQRVTR